MTPLVPECLNDGRWCVTVRCTCPHTHTIVEKCLYTESEEDLASTLSSTVPLFVELLSLNYELVK